MPLSRSLLNWNRYFNGRIHSFGKSCALCQVKIKLFRKKEVNGFYFRIQQPFEHLFFFLLCVKRSTRCVMASKSESRACSKRFCLLIAVCFVRGNLIFTIQLKDKTCHKLHWSHSITFKIIFPIKFVFSAAQHSAIECFFYRIQWKFTIFFPIEQ